MSARDKILAKLQATLDEGEATSESRARAAASRIRRAEQTAPVPKAGRLDGMARIDQFVERARAGHAEVRRLSHLTELPASLAEELKRRVMPMRVRIGDDPVLASLEWGEVAVSIGPGRVEEPATLTSAVAGLAETGTLVFRSGSDAPSSLNFLGEIHFAVVRARDVHAGLEGLWRQFRESNADPRTINLVTGPSRTADIEQQLELGAHGPTALFIFLIDDF